MGLKCIPPGCFALILTVNDKENIEANKVIFLCIQIQCASTWGLIPKIISSLTKLKLEVIDNRSWHPRGVDSTLMTEIFVQDDHFLEEDELEKGAFVDDRIADVNDKIVQAIRQPVRSVAHVFLLSRKPINSCATSPKGATVKVTRWYPGVLQAIDTKSEVSNSYLAAGKNSNMSVKDMLAREASQNLESKRNLQVAATKEKTLSEIKEEMGIPEEKPISSPDGAPPTKARKRVRQKMRSTPVVGGSLFDDPRTSQIEKPKVESADDNTVVRQPFSDRLAGKSAELTVDGEVFKIRVMPETIHRIRSGYSGELLDDSSVRFSSADVPIERRLEGFVRNNALQTISEDISETEHSEDRDSDRDRYFEKTSSGWAQ